MEGFYSSNDDGADARAPQVTSNLHCDAIPFVSTICSMGEGNRGPEETRERRENQESDSCGTGTSEANSRRRRDTSDDTFSDCSGVGDVRKDRRRDKTGARECEGGSACRRPAPTDFLQSSQDGKNTRPLLPQYHHIARSVSPFKDSPRERPQVPFPLPEERPDSQGPKEGGWFPLPPLGAEGGHYDRGATCQMLRGCLDFQWTSECKRVDEVLKLWPNGTHDGEEEGARYGTTFGREVDNHSPLLTTIPTWGDLRQQFKKDPDFRQVGIVFKRVETIILERAFSLACEEKANIHLKNTWMEMIESVIKRRETIINKTNNNKRKGKVNFDVTSLLDQKVERWEGETIAGVTGFTVDELKEDIHGMYERLRPIFNPDINRFVPEKGVVYFRSKEEIRQISATKKYHVTLDFSAYYDQIPLPAILKPYFIFVKDDEETHRPCVYTLSTLPMGFRWSVALACALTWTIMNFRIDADVIITTYIDNIRISSNNITKLRQVVKETLSRCAEINATINIEEGEEYLKPEVDETIAPRPHTFLGERYEGLTRQLTTKGRQKIEYLYQRVSHQRTFTAQQMACITGTLIHYSELVGRSLNGCFHFLRKYRQAMAGANLTVPWGTNEVTLSPGEHKELTNICGIILEAPPYKAHLTPFRREITIIVDASKEGYGGMAVINNRVSTCSGKWDKAIDHSTDAEPLGVMRVVRDLLPTKFTGDVIILTDHLPLTFAMRVPKAFYYNAMHQYLNSWSRVRFKFQHIPGVENPTDGLSRNTRVTDEEIQQALKWHQAVESFELEPEQERRSFMV